MKAGGEAERDAGPDLSINDGSKLSPVCCLIATKVTFS